MQKNFGLNFAIIDMDPTLAHLPRTDEEKRKRARESRARWRWAVDAMEEWFTAPARPSLGIRRWMSQARLVRFVRPYDSWQDVRVTTDSNWNVVASNNTCVTFHLPDQQIFLKVHRVRTWKHALKSMFRHGLLGRSKTTREVHALLNLASRQIPVPTPVAYGDARCWGWLTGSMLVTRAVPDSENLDCWLDRHSDRANRARKQFLERLAECVRRLHGASYCHGRLTFRNVLVCRRDGTNQPVLLDTDKTGRLRTLVMRKSIAWDLANLDACCQGRVSRTERLRFFLSYRGHDRLTPADKELLGRILDISAQRRQQEYRRLQTARSFDSRLYGRDGPPATPSH